MANYLGDDMFSYPFKFEQDDVKPKLGVSAEYESDNEDTTSAGKCHKATQVDIESEDTKILKRSLKHWQDIAGLRAARLEYLQLDIRDMTAEQSRQADYINYLKAKLDRAIKEIMFLKTRRCRCEEEEELEIFMNKSFSSIGL